MATALAIPASSLTALPKDAPPKLLFGEGPRKMYEIIKKQAAILMGPDAPPQGPAEKGMHALTEIGVGMASAIAVPFVIESQFAAYKTLDVWGIAVPLELLLALAALGTGAWMYSYSIPFGNLALEGAKGVAYGYAHDVGRELGKRFVAA